MTIEQKCNFSEEVSASAEWKLLFHIFMHMRPAMRRVCGMKLSLEILLCNKFASHFAPLFRHTKIFKRI